MEYMKLGKSGLEVSRICLGCMSFGDKDIWIHKWVLDEENSRPKMYIPWEEARKY